MLCSQRGITTVVFWFYMAGTEVKELDLLSRHLWISAHLNHQLTSPRYFRGSSVKSGHHSGYIASSFILGCRDDRER